MQDPANDLSALRERLQAGDVNVVRCAALPGQALALVDAGIGATCVFWEEDTSSGPVALVGLDTAVLLRESGEGRFRSMIEQQARTFAALRMPGDLGHLVRFFGGSAFSTGRDGSGCWEDFGDSTFLLPRVLYVDGPEGAEFIVVDAPDAPGGTERTLTVLAAAQKASETAPKADQESPIAPAVEATRESASAREFEELVRAAQVRIASGQVDKVALARRVTLTLGSAPRIGSLLRRLRTTATGAIRFAFRIGERTFVGATPETLVERQGRRIRTEALAGTLAKSEPRTERALLESAKDQDEHRYVVEALRSALAPLCSHLEVAPEASIKELPQLLHLCTPIAGELSEAHHVLDLVERLHPTPAVCGSPKEEAFRFIVQHEAAPRGWYAAPFGWVNQTGDGHFVVGLRSALIHGRNVHLYAGAGVVRASEPKLEYEETELKLQSIRSALGLGERMPASPPAA